MSIPNSVETTETGLLRWPRYFPRQMVRATDLNASQAFFIERLRRHNRFLHGFGVVAGLDVGAATVTAAGLTVTVQPGYAISPDGDEIFVPQAETVTIDCVENLLGDCTNLGGLPPADGVIFLVLRYDPQSACALPGFPEYCDPATVCNDSRWQEGYAFACLDELPAAYQTQPDCAVVLDNFNQQNPPALQAIPSGGDVLLACLTLQRDPASGALTGASVDMDCRRVLFSTGGLQGVLRCLPSAPAPVPAVVTTIIPASNAVLINPPPNVTITFSKLLQPLTVNANSITVERAPFTNPLLFQPVAGSVGYNPATLSAIFTPGPNAPFEAGFIYRVTARGDGVQAIIGVDNLRLDGDANGVEGGNFVSTFQIAQIEPHIHDIHDFHIHEIHEPHEIHVHDIHEIHDIHVHEIHELHHDLHEIHEIHTPHGIGHEFGPIIPGGVEPIAGGPGVIHIPVEAVTGVTPALADTLRANNIVTAADLVGRTIADLAGLLGITKAAARKLNKAAKDLLA
jgi:hypothetical protein